MAKKAYIGVDGVARKVKKGYIGVEGLARKIKKAYIGIGGVARPCWSGGLEYYGTITGLNATAWLLASAKAGDKLIFAGGAAKPNASYRDDTTVYDPSLTVSSAGFLSQTRQELSGLSFGEYAIFAGGDASPYYKDTVDIYNASLSRQSKTLTLARGKMAAAKVGNYAIFAGGHSASARNHVDIFDASLTRTNPTLSKARYSAGGAVTGRYAIIAGGYDGEALASVETFDESLTRSVADDISLARYRIAGVTQAGRALFVGGYGDSGAVDVYDENLTHTVLPATVVKGYTRGTVLGEYALFHGGRDKGSALHADVVVYDESLTASITNSMSSARWGEAAGTVGNYALFAGGGVTTAEAGTTVDAYTLA